MELDYQGVCSVARQFAVRFAADRRLRPSAFKPSNVTSIVLEPFGQLRSREASTGALA
jgi:hypothetical protein